jgi:hypothetical protein
MRDWFVELAPGSTVEWWSSDLAPDRGRAWGVVGVSCPRVEIDVGAPLLGGTVCFVRAPWDDVRSEPFRMHAEPDLCAWCLFDELALGLVAVEVAPLGPPLDPEARVASALSSCYAIGPLPGADGHPVAGV